MSKTMKKMMKKMFKSISKPAKNAAKKPLKSAPKPKNKSAGSRIPTKSRKAVQKIVKQKTPKKITKPHRKSSTTSRGKTKQQKTTAKRSQKPVKQPVQKQPKLQKDQEFAQALLHQEAAEKKPARQYPVLEGGSSERVSVLVPILKELVRKGVISDWLINLHHERSSSMYVERNFTVENETRAVKEDVLLTVYERFPDGMGEAQVPIIGADAGALRQQIMEAKQACAYAKKRAFALPQPSDQLQFPQGHDERMRKAIFSGSNQVTREIYDQIKATMSPITDVKLNSFEILTSASTARVLNSNGIDVSYHKSQIYVEFVLTCRAANEEREFIISRMACSPEQLNIQGALLQQAQIVRDATAAKPNPGFSGNVIFSGPSVIEFFAPHHDLNPLVLHTFAKLEHMGLSTFKRGSSIGAFTGEPITIISNPTLPLGLATAPVDLEGTPLKVVELIRNGVFVNYIAGARYAQYLNVPATGMVANIQVSPGATREEHLRGNDYFEIISFSWFNPNPFSGDFSAEIRLGYHWKNGRKTPLRGGTFTGNVFRNILNARFSKEVMQSGEYYGPRLILFKDAQIAKFE